MFFYLSAKVGIKVSFSGGVCGEAKPRDQIRVSHIAGRLFIFGVTREAPVRTQPTLFLETGKWKAMSSVF